MLRAQPILTIFRSAPLRGAVSAPSLLRTSLCQTASKSALWRRPRTSQNYLYTSASNSISRSSARRPNLVQLGRNLRRNSGKAVSESSSSKTTSQAAGSSSGSQASQSLSDKFKELSRKYGWAAVGVYLGLSVLDFPFCFLAVRLIGPERIGEAEHAVVDGFWNIVGTVLPSMLPEERTKKASADGGEVEASKSLHKDNASIWTQLLLAYGVHKSLIFFRIPLTAAVTPKIVKTLRGWGWNIGRPAKATKATHS